MVREPKHEVVKLEKRGVLLLSGGLDSTTVAAVARRRGYALTALTIDYGQRHRFELEAAARVAGALGVAEHVDIKIDLSTFGGSALTDEIAVPKGRSEAEMAAEIPVTYVPARNTVLLATALALAESRGVADLFVGVNAVDYSGYPDCRPEFVESFERLANLATAAGVQGDRRRLHAPLIDLTKAEIIRWGLELGVDYALTHTCYDPDVTGAACGECDACRLRLDGFAASGAVDPAQYVA